MTDDELGRAATTALKARFPEPADVDLLSGFHAPNLGRRRTTFLAAAASALVVAGVSTGLALTSGNDHPSATPGQASPRQGTTQIVGPPTLRSCTPGVADVTVRLGGAKLRGNMHPVRATVPAGDVVRVVARFGTRKLTFPATRSHDLSRLCHKRHGSVYTSYFLAARVGTATVVSQTSGCGPCMNTSFRARIMVARPPAQFAQLRERAFAAVPHGADVEEITAVRSTDAHAERVLTGDVVHGKEQVWVVQIQTARPFACACSRPPGVAAPQGKFAVLYLVAADLRQTGYSLGMHPSPLAKLGQVITLYSR